MPSRKVNRRGDILRAAEKLMRSHGLSGVTTRGISKEVGCSEGALYVHFKGRLELLLAMLVEGLPDMLAPLRVLGESVGRGSPQRNLATAFGGIFKFHRRILPSTCGLFAEPDLLMAYRESLARQGKGPHLSMAALENYIAAEQKLGRIEPTVDSKMAASLLMSSSFFYAFVEEFFGAPIGLSWAQFSRRLIERIVPEKKGN